MSDVVVVDSSVAFKWFSPARENDCPRALELLDQHRAGSVTLAAPTLLRLEVINGFWKRGGTAADLTAVAETLDGFGLAWFDASAALAAAAASIAAEHRLTVYDALFVALALSLDAELVTADRKIIAAQACRVSQIEG